MKLSPEMIDAAVIQLRTVFLHEQDIPEKVRVSGKTFLDELDAWSEEMKAGNAAVPKIKL